MFRIRHIIYIIYLKKSNEIVLSISHERLNVEQTDTDKRQT